MSSDYEKPESQKMGGDELEDVSGGAGAGDVPHGCFDGSNVDPEAGCGEGSTPTYNYPVCRNGNNPGSKNRCAQGTNAVH